MRRAKVSMKLQRRADEALAASRSLFSLRKNSTVADIVNGAINHSTPCSWTGIRTITWQASTI